MNDSKETFRLEICIDRASARRALMVGGILLVMAAAGVAFAVPVTFKDGDTLTAAVLNQNFTNLEGRVAAIETARSHESLGGKYSNGAAYCGFTINTSGDLSGLTAAGRGYAKAKAACEAVPGCSPAAHVCTPDEIFRTVSTGIDPANGWVMSQEGPAGVGTNNGCAGFTSNTSRGTFWGSGTGTGETILGDASCGQSLPMLCCH